ncbi:MAG: ATP-binding protein [Spirochaetes bacterium]|nr:ATP-binding protein [Spirochaetota bacterium]
MDYLVFSFLSPIATVLLLVTFLSIWRFRHILQGRTLLWYLGLVVALLLSNTAELFSSTREGTLFWGRMQHVFLAFVPVAWVAFSLRYAGFDHLVSFKKLYPITIVPFLTVFIVLTNGTYHRFFWKEVLFFQVEGFLTFKAQYGPFFWIYGAYTYLLIYAGVFLILRSYLGSKKTYRNQSLWVVHGVLFPIPFNLIYVFRLLPFLRKDFTSVSFALAGICFFIGVFKHHLLRVVPIARNTIVEDMDRAILVVDKDRCIVDFNRRARKLFALEDRDLGAMLCTHPILSTWIPQQILQNPILWETCFERKYGDEYYGISIDPVRNSSGTTVGTLITFSNITDRVTYIKEKMKLLKELERINQELKTVQLQLLQQEKLAAIGQLAAGIAHEINNPLAYLKSNFYVIRQYLERIRELQGKQERFGALLDEARRTLSESEEGFHRITNIIRDLLTFSRRSLEDEVKPYDLNEGVETALRLASSEYKHSIVVEREKTELPLVPCRGEEINQVILILLSNAIHAVQEGLERNLIQKGEGKIVVRTRTVDKGVLFEIENNGPPIPENHRSRLFEPFFTTKPEGKGTGLGLSIAREIIVNRHGGNLTFESGKTTKFRFVLPMIGANYAQ